MSKPKLRVCDAAAQVLRETGNDAVMWGDTSLVYQIARRAGIKLEERYTFQVEQRVLNALSRQPGCLTSKLTTDGRGRSVRIFRMPPEPVSSDV